MPQQAGKLATLSDEELDAAIAKKQGRDLTSLSDEELDKAIAEQMPKAKSSGLDLNALKVGAEEGITFGARPFIAGIGGGLGMAYGRLKDGASLSELPGAAKEGFTQARKEAQAEQARVAQESPGSYILGNIGGSVAMPGAALKAITGGAQGVLGAARIGAAMGAGQALGNADDLSEAVHNVASGAGFGIGTQLVGQGIGKATDAIARRLEKRSIGNALKSAGAMLKDYRNLEGKGKADQTGQFLLDKGIVKAGDSVESVANKSEAARKEAGNVISTIYEKAKESFGDSTPGLDLKSQKKAILDKASEALGNAEGKGTALGRLERYLDERIAEFEGKGLNVLDPKSANDIKGALDDVINYARDPLKKEPTVEIAFKSARDFVSKQIDQSVEAIGKALGDDTLLSQLKEANKIYGTAKHVSNMASDRVRRESANAAFGLRQSILTGGGAVAGGLTGISSGDPTDVLTGAAKGAAVGASLKTVERYGPAILAQAQNALAKQLQTNAPLRRIIQKNPLVYQTLLKKTAEQFTGPGGVPSGVPQMMMTGDGP